MFETLTRQQLDAMTSEQYKENFQGPNGEAFRARINELENGPRPAATRPAGNVRGDDPTPTPGMTSFDPSFDNDPNDGPSSAAPAAAPKARGVRGRVERPAQPAAALADAPAQPAAAPAAGTLAIWRYQPKDEQGRPVGGEQVFKYDPSLPIDDPKSLASQLTKSNMHATVALKAKRTQAVIDEVKKVETGYKPPVFLTADQHPDFEALNEVTRNTIANGTQSAMNAFRMAHPEFVACEDNAIALVKWVEKSGRSPVDAQTWELAWAALKPYLAVPVAAPVVEVPAPAPAPVPAAAAPVAATTRHALGAATGLSDADVFNVEPVAVASKVQGVKIVLDGKPQVLDLRAWERMSSDVQKRILRSQSNASAIETLYGADSKSPTEFWNTVNSPPKRWAGPKFRTRKICRECNNEWMSDLESAVRPTMGALVNDISMTLDAGQQRLLALWAVKTAMVIEGVKQAKNHFYSAAQRSVFRTTLVPPEDTTVWLGRCVQSNLLHGEARKLNVSNQRATNPLEDGCATTFVVGRLVMQVLSVKRKPDAPRGGLSLKIRAGAWESKLVQIWPVEKQIVSWPPPQNFSDLDDGLRDLRRRFAVSGES
jgi:hypothetical protein